MSARLLIDVGNTRLKWTIADDSGLLTPVQALAHGGDPAALVEWLPLPDGLHDAWIANVTGEAPGERLAAALSIRHRLHTRFARPVDGLAGLALAYPEPTRLGVDRWLALLAVWTRERAASCVASAGTALTFDAVDSDGRHLGGIIAPGLFTAQAAVLGATRFAASGPSQHYTRGLGSDTDACVRQGALHACAGLIDRLAARHPGTRYLIGGDAGTLLPHLDGVWQLQPDLVLSGLATLARS
ncbi:type III pantothenate kinase [Nevskia sp.]|uniref:type III pantothenate kinase n=1 Tax=Nevskia sp. TaxID=1929292 RepID=UPI0025FC1C55|nr:type III pantothenate kinase [Nevskia sp.]